MSSPRKRRRFPGNRISRPYGDERMRRSVTWFLVGAVAAIAVAAAVEALGDGSGARPAPTTTRERPAAPPRPVVPISGQEDVRELLEAAGERGVLHFADRNCRLRTLLLPAVEWRPQPDRAVPCRFTIGAAGEVEPDEVRIERQSGLRAVCRGNGVEVFGRAGGRLTTFAGACAPAWRPDGSLAFVRDGGLVLAPEGRAERVLLSRGELGRALGRGSELLEAAWFDEETYAAAVRRGAETVVAVFRGSELRAPPSFSSPLVRDLRATDRMLAARTASRGPAVTFLSRAGREILTVDGGHSVSWSPGGLVAAVAGRAVLVFVNPSTRERAPLALVATDLEWR